MQVPGGTIEYEQHIRKSKDYLRRLRKGRMMLEKAIQEKEFLEAQEIIRLWDKLANEVFVELELATLIHQHYITGSKVLIKSDGAFVDSFEIMDHEAKEIDPWTLLSLEKLKDIIGSRAKDLVEIKDS